MLIALKETNCLNGVLVSQADGWAVEGDEAKSTGLKLFGIRNHEPNPNIFERLLPKLTASGFSNAEINQLMHLNPVDAFAVRVRTS